MQILKQSSREAIVQIPDGFRNNIWWNIAHVVVTQQLLLYGLSDLPLGIDETLVAKYRKGTVPEGEPSDEEIAEVQRLMMSTIDQAETDYRNGMFQAFKPYTTSVGVTLESVEDAICFNAYHQGLHLGVIMSLKKLV